MANTLEREMNLAFFRPKMKRSANKSANEFENKAILLANSSKKSHIDPLSVGGQRMKKRIMQLLFIQMQMERKKYSTHTFLSQKA